MAKPEKIIKLIREKIRNQEYEFTVPHFFEEMVNDNLLFADIEKVIASGNIKRMFNAGLVMR